MTDFEISVTFGTNTYQLKAVIVYESSQIMRIRVFGKYSSILLENNYPLLTALNSKKGIKWQIKEGQFEDKLGNGRLLIDIISQLEHYIKGKHLQPTLAEYLQSTKR